MPMPKPDRRVLRTGRQSQGPKGPRSRRTQEQKDQTKAGQNGGAVTAASCAISVGCETAGLLLLALWLGRAYTAVA